MKRLWIFAGVLVLAACGIQPTGSVDAGVAARATWQATTVYYLIDGEPQPAVRPTMTVAGVQDLGAALAAGPTEQERSSGMDTEVPSSLRLTVDEGRLVVDTPGSLSEAALDQVVCTVSRSDVALREGTTLHAPDGTVVHDADCPAT